MDRRQFVLTAVAAAAVPAGLRFAPVAARALQTAASGKNTTRTDEAAADPAISSRARELYRRARVLDCNLAPDFDTLPLPGQTLEMARQSGLTAMKATIGGFNSDFEATVAEIAAYQRLVEWHPDVFLQVREPGDFAAAKRSGRVGIILSFETVTMLDGKVERIELFRNLGVRVMQLSYNLASPFGAGVLVAEASAGLTESGRAAVARMNELGVTIDVSHANPRTTADVLAASRATVIMTHAGCSAVHAHPRNKTDIQLRALADQGGVVGVYDLPYLVASPRQPRLEDYMRHMVHALDTCGEDHVGIGSDQSLQPFDTTPGALAAFRASVEERRARGVSAPEEDRPAYTVGLNVPTRCEVIADALLKQGFPSRVTEKVLGENFIRVFTGSWTAPAGGAK
jgi:membrane dipeptidase